MMQAKTQRITTTFWLETLGNLNVAWCIKIRFPIYQFLLYVFWCWMISFGSLDYLYILLQWFLFLFSINDDTIYKALYIELKIANNSLRVKVKTMDKTMLKLRISLSIFYKTSRVFYSGTFLSILIFYTNFSVFFR